MRLDREYWERFANGLSVPHGQSFEPASAEEESIQLAMAVIVAEHRLAFYFWVLDNRRFTEFGL